MKKTNLQRKLSLCLVVVFLLASLISNYSFAYVEGATWGVKDPFPASRVFYNADGSIKTIYTYYNELNFSISSNPSSQVNPDLTQVFMSKETMIGSGKFNSWVDANAITWGAVSASSVGGIFYSCPYYKVALPGEGRYKVQVKTYDANGISLYSQQFIVLYSNSIVRDRPELVVNDATVDTKAFADNKGYWSRVNYTVHDLTGKGLTQSDIRLRLCNQAWMSASRGYASSYKPTDITITRSTVNPDEYSVSATINATLFNNIAGEYYIECQFTEFSRYWSRMFPRLYIR